MENASKALLIAGSILIAIILIAVGMKVINSTSGTTDSVESTMKSTEIATFNNKFISYAGQNKSAAQVRSLVNVIISSNATSDHNVNINNSPAQDFMLNNLGNGNYTITISSYSNGFISNITISGGSILSGGITDAGTIPGGSTTDAGTIPGGSTTDDSTTGGGIISGGTTGGSLFENNLGYSH